ncbi:hypothetical protein AVEN_58733-1 [Araneus ventricosus]|uniref:Uncharacterized protein n=1 Tax=Araneus ventricosus TaxID=182803 RepID=A0A4Y2VF41_ARAVE|nr:hypothetical protein AVEN_58733-1 [Araneus ventricosus]
MSSTSFQDSTPPKTLHSQLCKQIRDNEICLRPKSILAAQIPVMLISVLPPQDRKCPRGQKKKKDNPWFIWNMILIPANLKALPLETCS